MIANSFQEIENFEAGARVYDEVLTRSTGATYLEMKSTNEDKSFISHYVCFGGNRDCMGFNVGFFLTASAELPWEASELLDESL